MNPSACAFAILMIAATVAGTAASQPKQANDLDAFMARVLERRDEAWRKLHDYVLAEREGFQVLGPGDLPLHGMKREYTWYVREGYLIRSPVRFDGADVPEADRRRYEDRWLRQEKDREKRAQERAARKPAAGNPGELPPGGAAEAGDPAEGPSLQEFVDQRGEPRFISEAYFLRFKFEPGNYYLVGRERLDGREVVRVEYYPTRLFADDHAAEEAGQRERAGRKTREQRREDVAEDEIERKMNKVAQVTLWIDPAEYQIVRYTFDNMDFGFLPGRWIARVDGASASMTMARVLDGVWLPSRITMSAGLSLASGGYRFQYGRDFSDYKRAEVRARIRSYTPKAPRP